MVRFKKRRWFAVQKCWKIYAAFTGKKIEIDDAKLHDEIVNLRKFLSTKINDDKLYNEQCASSRMCQFFAAKVNIEGYNNLLSLSIFLCISSALCELWKNFSSHLRPMNEGKRSLVCWKCTSYSLSQIQFFTLQLRSI